MLIISADKADCFANKSTSKSTLDTYGVSFPDIPLRNDSLYSDMDLTPSMISAIILFLLLSYILTRTKHVDMVISLQYPERNMLPNWLLISINCTINATLILAFLIVGNPRLWFQYLRTELNRLTIRTIDLLAFYVFLVNYYSS